MEGNPLIIDFFIITYIAQLMSSPQHRGDFIFPCPFVHFETCTFRPSSNLRTSLTNGELHLPQVALTDMPHLLHL